MSKMRLESDVGDDRDGVDTSAVAGLEGEAGSGVETASPLHLLII